MSNLDYFMGYERFIYGKNRACCKGFFVTGPGLSAFASLAYQILTLYFNLSWYIYLAPYHFTHLNYFALPIISMILGIFLHFLFLNVAF